MVFQGSLRPMMVRLDASAYEHASLLRSLPFQRRSDEYTIRVKQMRQTRRPAGSSPTISRPSEDTPDSANLMWGSFSLVLDSSSFLLHDSSHTLIPPIASRHWCPTFSDFTLPLTVALFGLYSSKIASSSPSSRKCSHRSRPFPIH